MNSKAQDRLLDAKTRDDGIVFSHLEECLLNNYQKNFPLEEKPFNKIANDLNCNPLQLLNTLKRLQEDGAVSRIGPVFKPNSVNKSLLAAMKVPEDMLLEVAEMINGYEEVNHNYEREHHFNLWFVVHGKDEHHVNEVLDDIETRTGMMLIRLPILDAYHIDLGFDLRC